MEKVFLLRADMGCPAYGRGVRPAFFQQEP